MLKLDPKLLIVLISSMLMTLHLNTSLAAARTTSADQVVSKTLHHLYNKVILSDSQAALVSLRTLHAELQKPAPNWPSLQQQFSQFALAWKAVESLYIAGDLNDNYLDHTRFMDYFHQGNESITKQVKHALNSHLPVDKAFFKHAHKSLNALEAILFDIPTNNPQYDRRQAAALLSSTYLLLWMQEINDFYKSNTGFVNGGTKSLNILLNRLIDSSYKLANWRVGEAAGLTPKSNGSVNPQRLEFHHSQLSKAALSRILKSHQQILNNSHDLDLLVIGEAFNAKEDMAFLQKRLSITLDTLAAIPNPLTEQLETPAYEKLYVQLNMLQNAYYFMLINNLNLEAHILDADGD